MHQDFQFIFPPISTDLHQFPSISINFHHDPDANLTPYIQKKWVASGRWQAELDQTEVGNRLTCEVW